MTSPPYPPSKVPATRTSDMSRAQVVVNGNPLDVENLTIYFRIGGRLRVLQAHEMKECPEIKPEHVEQVLFNGHSFFVEFPRGFCASFECASINLHNEYAFGDNIPLRWRFQLEDWATSVPDASQEVPQPPQAQASQLLTPHVSPVRQQTQSPASPSPLGRRGRSGSVESDLGAPRRRRIRSLIESDDESNAESNAESDDESHAESDAESGSESGSESDSEGGSEGELDSELESEPERELESEPESELEVRVVRLKPSAGPESEPKPNNSRPELWESGDEQVVEDDDPYVPFLMDWDSAYKTHSYARGDLGSLSVSFGSTALTCKNWPYTYKLIKTPRQTSWVELPPKETPRDEKVFIPVNPSAASRSAWISRWIYYFFNFRKVKALSEQAIPEWGGQADGNRDAVRWVEFRRMFLEGQRWHVDTEQGLIVLSNEVDTMLLTFLPGFVESWEAPDESPLTDHPRYLLCGSLSKASHHVEDQQAFEFHGSIYWYDSDEEDAEYRQKVRQKMVAEFSTGQVALI